MSERDAISAATIAGSNRTEAALAGNCVSRSWFFLMILSTSSNSRSRRAALKTLSTRLILPPVSLARHQEAQPHSPASTGITKAPMVRTNITLESDQPNGGFTPSGASRQTMQAKDARIAATTRHGGKNKPRERRPTGRATAKTAIRILMSGRSAARVTIFVPCLRRL